MATDEASEESEFLSALNASLESFVVLAVLPTEFSKSAIYQLIPKVLFHMGSTANATSKFKNHRCFLLAYKEERYLNQLTR